MSKSRQTLGEGVIYAPIHRVVCWKFNIGAYDLKSILRIPDNVKLLSPKQAYTLSPSDKDRYYDKVILDLLRANPSGVTVSEFEDATDFMGRTIRSHLKSLVARGEAQAISRGKMSIYQSNGETIDKPTSIESIAKNGTVYVVNPIKDNGGNISYYIQEKELDAYRTLRVKGGITIQRGDIKKFITELHTMSLKESGQEK